MQTDGTPAVSSNGLFDISLQPHQWPTDGPETLEIKTTREQELQAAINAFAEEYRQVKAWHDAPLIKRLFDLSNDQGHVSPPGASAANRKDVE